MSIDYRKWLIFYYNEFPSTLGGHFFQFRLLVSIKIQSINVHKVFPDYVKNRYSTYDHDMPESVKVTEWDDERIKKWASKIGPYTRKVIDNIFLTSIVKEQGYNPALSVLHLSDKYSKERLEISCQIALSKHPSPRYKHLNAILANNQDRQNLQENMKKEEKATGHLRGPEFYGGRSK